MDAVMQDKAHDPGVVYRGARKSLYGSSPDSPLEETRRQGPSWHDLRCREAVDAFAAKPQ